MLVFEILIFFEIYLHTSLSASLLSIICRYLHEVCSPSVVHKNFKSANILLDSEFNPHLSDSGLASLIPDEDQVASCMPFVLSKCLTFKCLVDLSGNFPRIK